VGCLLGFFGGFGWGLGVFVVVCCVFGWVVCGVFLVLGAACGLVVVGCCCFVVLGGGVLVCGGFWACCGVGFGWCRVSGCWVRLLGCWGFCGGLLVGGWLWFGFCVAVVWGFW